MTDSSVHDIFEVEAADRDLPSPYMEKYFAKFEGLFTILSQGTNKILASCINAISKDRVSSNGFCFVVASNNCQNYASKE